MSSFVSYERYSTDNNNNNNITNDIIKKNATTDLNFELELEICKKKCNEDFEKEVKRRGLRGLLKFNKLGMPDKNQSKKRRPSIKQRVLRERTRRAKVELKLLVRKRNKCIERCEAEMEMKYLNLIMKQKGMDEDTEGLIGQYLLPKSKKGEWIVHNIKFKKSKTRKSSSKTRKSSSKTRKSSSKTKKKGGSKSKKKKSKSPSKKKGETKRRKKGGSKTKKKYSSK